MSSLSDLLVAKQIRTALIVDDAYDLVPLAAELGAIDRPEWSQFFTDLTEEDKIQIAAVYSPFEQGTIDELIEDDAFVKSLWEIQGVLSVGTADVLFQRYIADNAESLLQLRALEQVVAGLGLETSTSGRRFEEVAITVDLIIIDLFLGGAQSPSDMQASIDALEAVSKKRPSSPPLVVLMSSSTRLEANYAAFRDQTGLFASAFRFIQKSKLSDIKSVESLLHRLAFHRHESIRLAAFVHAWQVALGNASQRTTALLRTLDLPDYGQLYNLLLAEEGAPTGSFLVDVIDHVLKHEVEAENGIIQTAKALNEIDFTNYPPHYIGESSDLQQFVYRSTFQHPARLSLDGAIGSKIAFGDLLIPKPTDSSPQCSAESRNTNQRLEISAESVFVVLTPACSLQRGAAKRVLLLAGTVSNLTARDWYVKDTPIRTPVIELSDGSRRWIKWDLDHIETVSKDDLDVLLSSSDGLQVAARLRELYAVELQQKLLSRLGKVGVPASLPATFEVSLKLLLPGVDGKLFPIVADGLDSLKGIIYVGRQEDKLKSHLALTESACSLICLALQSLRSSDRVHQNGRPRLQKIIEELEPDLLMTLWRGLVIKPASNILNNDSFSKVSFWQSPPNAGGLLGTACHVVRSAGAEGYSFPNVKILESPIVVAVCETEPVLV